jgi:putative solute:sodium symporter small subunit
LRLFAAGGSVKSGVNDLDSPEGRRRGVRLIDSRETPRWAASWALTVGIISAATLFALAPVMFASMTDGSTLLGLPVSYFLSGIVVPPLIAVTIFWFAESQERIDRRFDGPPG